MTELTIAQSNPLTPTAKAGKTKAQYYAEIKAKRTHACLHCKKEYVTKRKHLSEGHKFCSRECAFAHKAENTQPVYSKVFFNTCVVCTAAWVSKRKTVAWCSDECGKERARRYSRRLNVAKHEETIKQRECKECSNLFTPAYGVKLRSFCSAECGSRHSKRNAKATRKARLRGASQAESVDVLEIFRRDKWKCKCCGIKTPWTHRGTIKPTAPELDHIMPLAEGGKHIKSNVQLLCRRCNNSKSSNSANDQMLLFG